MVDLSHLLPFLRAGIRDSLAGRWWLGVSRGVAVTPTRPRGALGAVDGTPLKQVKGRTTEWDKTLANHMFGKGPRLQYIKNS